MSAPARGGRRSQPPFIGLTGGIAAGKSEALSALRRLGAATLSSDDVVHELLGTEEVRDLLVERFGPEVAPGGTIDRARVAATVFERSDRRAWLEGMLWPRVAQRVSAWRDEVTERDPAPEAAVVEVPLLFEAGMEDVFDTTIAVVADDAVRQVRADERGHTALESRSSRQLAQAEKAERADFVVENNGDLADLEGGLSRVLATIGR